MGAPPQTCRVTHVELGGGDVRHPGYTNIDVRPECADIAHDLRDPLPLPDGSVESLLAYDVVEHLPPAHTRRLLAEIHRVLQPGGRAHLRVPNLLALAQMIVSDRATEAAIRNIYGGHRFGPEGEWDCHHTGWTPALFASLLQRSGFTVVANDEAINMTVEVTK